MCSFSAMHIVHCFKTTIKILDTERMTDIGEQNISFPIFDIQVRRFDKDIHIASVFKNHLKELNTLFYNLFKLLHC